MEKSKNNLYFENYGSCRGWIKKHKSVHTLYTRLYTRKAFIYAGFDRDKHRDNVWYGFAQTLLSFGHFPYQGNNIVPYELPTNLYGDVCRGKRPRLPEITEGLLGCRQPPSPTPHLPQKKSLGYPKLFGLVIRLL